MVANKDVLYNKTLHGALLAGTRTQSMDIFTQNKVTVTCIRLADVPKWSILLHNLLKFRTLATSRSLIVRSKKVRLRNPGQGGFR